MRASPFSIAATVALGLAAGAALAAPESYTIDSNHTFPSFEISHMGFSIQRGRFNETTGRITLDRAAKQATVDITIAAKSIDTGLDKLEEHLRKADFFDVEKYPTIAFKSTKATFQGDVLTGLDGQLTLHGKTQPVSLKVTQFKCGTNAIYKKEWCGAEATATIKRSDFGITIYPPPALGEEVKLFLQVEAAKD
jgi:polyisoprenoid-binding protein YceI